ncbi:MULTISPECIES: small, acid-soluble spore protein K [Bacillaceae]|uniref:small, acid-soluble spore protein K n=1 Tax=Bacillaceae TaxID=186817 RepID=UPI00101BA50C|nr:small, acid-soluble spore protein K [Ectobacillus funiculus]
MGTHISTSSERHSRGQSDETTRAKARFASKRPDGTINTHPQERMRASNHQS